MRHTATKDVFRHWSAMCGENRVPDRSQLDPTALGQTLADVFLLEAAGGQARFRLAGSRVCALFGTEIRDKRFDSIFSQDSASDALDMIDSVQQDRAPVIAGISALFPGKVSSEGEMLLLPLTHQAGTDGSSRILGVLTTLGYRPPHQAPCTELELISFRVLNALPRAKHENFGDFQPMRAISDGAILRRSRFRILDGGLS